MKIDELQSAVGTVTKEQIKMIEEIEKKENKVETEKLAKVAEILKEKHALIET